MKKAIVIVLLLIIIVAGGILGYMIYRDRVNGPIDLGTELFKWNDEEAQAKTVKKIQIYQGDERPIAVMIDNHKAALPQGGLNDAYMVYEIIVEGGESRLMALFKGKQPEKIGPVRSARHYFLDYALENDAIYVHYGWSPKAESDISSLKVNNINGLVESESNFWRVKDKSAPHNVATTIEKIKSIAERKGYRTTSTADSVLKYSVDEIELEEGIIANTISIPYSDSNTVKYTYDATTKRYQRYSKGVEEKDWSTGDMVTTKNIIITYARNATLNDGENKDRQTLYNVNTLDGYYITNGKAIKITCEKTTRSGKTVYKDETGKEINVNDGNTFMQICPINADVTISE